MLSQSQNNSLMNLQKQSTYGLSRQSQSVGKDTVKGVQRSKVTRKSKENPFANHDMNRSASKSRSKDRSAKKVRIGKSGLTVGRNAAEKSLSPMKTTSPKLGGKKRAIVARSPATTSLPSSGKKTPCISALVQPQQYVGHIDMKYPAAQKSAPRYEIDSSRIAEEEHDSSSFLAAEREAQQVAADESASMADTRSQFSQNLMGAHLVANKDLYPYCRGEVFQTPQPLRGEGQSYQSPMTSFRNLQSSNILSGRVDTLQMSQKTNVTNQVVSNGARICYEKDSFASQTISPIQEQVTCAGETDFNNLQQSKQHHMTQTIKSPPVTKSFLYDRSRELSGLALNVRQQTSPEPASSRKDALSPSNIHIDSEGRVRVVANQLGQIVENSYDNDNATRFMDESGALSPDSTNKILNPYYNSQHSKFSSINQHHMSSTSPANIKVEPVQVSGPSVITTGFEHQRKASHEMMRACGSLRNSPIKEASRSPSKTSGLNSPSPMGKSPQPAMQMHVISICDTEQSPEVAIPALTSMTDEAPGVSMRSQSMYENLMRLQKVESVPEHKQILHATITEEDENCATISVSEISTYPVDPQPTVEQRPVVKTNSSQRPKSSQLPTRRRREERKTPTGRSTATFLERFTKTKDDRVPARRTKYSSNTNAGASNLDNSVSSSGPQTEEKQINCQTTQRRVGLKKNISSSQTRQISIQEQTRLANRAKARQYGNRVSELNKSGSNLRQDSSPSGKTVENAHQNSSNTLKGKRGVSSSPNKPEILSVTDLSLMISNPTMYTSTTNSQVEKKNRRKNSISNRNKQEVQMSRAEQIAKAEFMAKQSAAIKIQRCYRIYLDRQAEIQRIFAFEQKQKAQRAHMAFINAMASRIQRAYKVYMSFKGFKQALQSRKRLKMIVTDLCSAWRTRRSLNCLGSEVQEFVNCENAKQRVDLRKHFHLLYQKVVQNKLFLESNFERLQKVKQQIAAKVKQSKSRSRVSKPTSATRQRKQVVQQSHKTIKFDHDSPFKKPVLQQESPARQTSPISLQNMNESSHASVSNIHGRYNQAPRLQSHGAIANYRSRDNLPPQSQARNSIMNSSRRQQNQVASSRLLNSAGSVGSQNNMGDETVNINLVRNSFDNQAMLQLRDFIQNSGRKSDKYCSIQLTNGLKSNDRVHVLQMNSNGNNTQENSHVMVQMHNKSLQDIISPTNAKSVSSAALPMSNSCQRLQQKRIMTAVEMSEPAAEAPQPPKPLVSGFVCSATNIAQQDRKNSQEQTAEKVEIRQNLKKIRPRVDCWNRSTTRGETTRGEASRGELIQNQVARVDASQKEVTSSSRVILQASEKRQKTKTAQRDLQTIRQEQRSNVKSDSAIKTPVQNRRPATSTNRNHHGSFRNDIVSKNPLSQNNTGGKQQQQEAAEPESRSRSTNMLSSQPRAKSKSLLREPTKFNNKNTCSGYEKQHKIEAEQPAQVEVRRMSHNNVRSATPMNALASRNAQIQQQQSLRPKSSRQQIQPTVQQQQQSSASNLKQFINVAKPQERKTGKQKTQAPPTIQTQIFQMRETMANLTQVMEQIATEADSRQRESLQNKGGFGLNSQHRAAIKSLTAQEKVFNELVNTLSDGFVNFRDLAMPNNPSAHAGGDQQV